MDKMDWNTEGQKLINSVLDTYLLLSNSTTNKKVQHDNTIGISSMTTPLATPKLSAET
ncbi:hypothetical protein C1H46_040847 [Malus baccata]|uniref:Uncharacterized protein n=1 Tax=Malus baccata TaxID=106549 RepID=A0A540KHH5_MALBA|nr:hypothetical protein C1H46_040847 [Malus baccata]